MTKLAALKQIGNGGTQFMLTPHDFVHRDLYQPLQSEDGETSSNISDDTNITTDDTNLHRTTFPWQLHTLLETAASEGFDHIVSWLDNNSSFKVHKPALFVKHVLPRFFSRQSKYKSFQRQLNIWQFERLIGSRGPRNGGYFHVFFHRYDTSLFHLIKRSKLTGASLYQGKLKPDNDHFEDIKVLVPPAHNQASFPTRRKMVTSNFLVPQQNVFATTSCHLSHPQHMFISNPYDTSMTNSHCMESNFPVDLLEQTAFLPSHHVSDHVVTSLHSSTTTAGGMSMVCNIGPTNNGDCGSILTRNTPLCSPSSLDIIDNLFSFPYDNDIDGDDETCLTQPNACSGDIPDEGFHSSISEVDWKYVLVGMQMAMMT